MFPAQIVSDARTVIDLAAHFAELQRTSLQLLEQSRASRRGFFTPSEDEELRHLLVSYWQSRNALIELVISLHHRISSDEPLFQETSDVSAETLRQATFLVAYTGATVLVDAARFLRENCEDRPAVVAKLNEPEPHFGIPEGTYDRVQKSLTSPVHVWHLYHAVRYFTDHRQELRDVAAGTPLQPLLEILNRLRDRLNIDVLDYAAARMRVRAQQLVTVVKRDLLSRALYGLQKAVSRLLSEKYVLPGHEPGLPAAVSTDLLRLLRPGDILITRKEHALTNYFLPGYWPHAAFYLGHSDDLKQLGISNHENVKPRWQRILECDRREDRRVLEALKDGVWIRSVSCPLASDAIAVIRPDLSNDQIAEAITRGLFHEGKPYDFDFDFTRSDRLVCTEVVYRSLEGVGELSFQLTNRAGRLTLAAEDLLELALKRQRFETIAVFSPNHTDRLQTGTSAADVIERIRETSSA